MLSNPRRERFCQEYIIDNIGAAAATRAGYAANSAKVTASRLLSDVNVKARIAELQAKVSERLEITVERVEAMLIQSYEDARRDKQHSAAARCAELLGKRLAMFVDVKVAEVEMTPDEVRAKIKRMVDANPSLVDLSRARDEREAKKGAA